MARTYKSGFGFRTRWNAFLRNLGPNSNTFEKCPANNLSGAHMQSIWRGHICHIFGPHGDSAFLSACWPKTVAYLTPPKGPHVGCGYLNYFAGWVITIDLCLSLSVAIGPIKTLNLLPFDFERKIKELYLPITPIKTTPLFWYSIHPTSSWGTIQPNNNNNLYMSISSRHVCTYRAEYYTYNTLMITGHMGRTTS